MLHSARCLLLDMGKVLIDFDFGRFAHRMQTLTGIEEEDLRRVLTADSLSHNFETGQCSASEFHREVCRRINAEVPEAEFREAWNSIFFDTPILPERLIESLARKVRIWVLSNTNRIHYEFISSRFSVLRYFRGHILSFEVGSRKPHPSIFKHALSVARAEPTETLFVDDQLTNVEAARNLGIDAFQFISPEQFSSELSERCLL